jgi:hypothetical protein
LFYLVIGIVLVVAVGAIISRSRHSEEPPRPESGEKTPSDSAVPALEEASAPPSGEAGDFVVLSAPAATGEQQAFPKEEIIPLKPLLAAEPISSPSALVSATYSSAAPAQLSADSPYSFLGAPEAKPKPEPALLRWSGRAGSIQVGDLTLRGPMAYWSSGPSSTPEPSCIDVTLPVEFPGENELPAEGAASYADMTPMQRGAYLQWLAGGRIQPPTHVCQPSLWLFGLERRVLSDRLDIALCIGEAFRLLPLLRWEPLRQGLVKFITWMAARIWLPEEQLLVFVRSLPAVPPEILNMLLRPYADAKLPLPSVIAFTLMRASSLGGPRTIPHTDDLVAQFAPIYKQRCQGGIVLSKPKTPIFVAYVPVNPSLAGDKNAVGGVLELPDFFRDPTDFNSLVAAWQAFLKEAVPPAEPAEEPPVPAREEVEARPDWVLFIQGLQAGGEAAGEKPAEMPKGPAVTELGNLADLMEIERARTPEGELRKPPAADRKKIVEAARIEGFLIFPDLGIAGKEYHWEDSIVVVPAETGARSSQDCNAAALLLEYAIALQGLTEEKSAAELRTRMDDYFSLSSDDHMRLEALSSVLLKHPTDLENIGECLRFWLSREQRAVVRDLLMGLLMSPGDLTEERRAELSRSLCASLEVARDAPPPVTVERTLDLGLRAAEVLAALFRD